MMNLDNCKNILIVSHDAGGAEILSAWVRKQKQRYQFTLLVDGPAVAIYEKKVPELPRTNCLKASLAPDMIISSTSWQSTLEKKTLVFAKENNIPAIAYLDHWCNYIDRFMFDDRIILPNTIWVGDSMGEKIAKETFKHTKVELIENQYFIDVINEIKEMGICYKANQALNILFICEPITEHALIQHNDEKYWGKTEFDIIKNFIEIASKLVSQPHSLTIRIRPHPSEKANKYDAIINSISEIKIERSQNKNLLRDIAWGNIIVGATSMGLVVALLSGKNTYTCLDKNSSHYSLPFPEIKHISELAV